MIREHIDKNNLHHAYLLEGAREEIVPEILSLLRDLKIETVGNPDFNHISLDSFKIEDARNLKSYAVEKANSLEKKIFLISTNNFLLEAQSSLLKMFEEPIPNTHFFLIVPDTNSLLKTFVSRFYFISRAINTNTQKAEEFIKMPLQNRINFIKDLLTEEENEDMVEQNGARSRALYFLNALETILSKNVSRMPLDTFHHLFKVREFLRMPGSSAKTLMESVALIVPIF